MLRSKQKTQQVLSHVCSLFYGSLTSSNIILVLNHKKAQLLPTIYTTLSCRDTPCLYSMRVSVRVCVKKRACIFYKTCKGIWQLIYVHTRFEIFIHKHTYESTQEPLFATRQLSKCFFFRDSWLFICTFFSRCGSCFCCCF